MQKRNKKKLLVFVGLPFIAWFSCALGQIIFDNQMAFTIILLINILFIFFIKKSIAKDLKNDELEKKIAILTDAIAGRVGLIFILLYGVLYTFDSWKEFLWTFKTWQTLSFILGIMIFSSIFASIYYNQHPEKL